MLIIPTYNENSSVFTQTITLEEKRVEISIAWNSISGFWVLKDFNLLDTGRSLQGIKMRKSFLILDPYKKMIPTFEGDLMIVPKRLKETLPLNEETLGVNYLLVYLTYPEIVLWRFSNGMVG